MISFKEYIAENWQRAVLRKHGSVKPGHWNGKRFISDLKHADNETAGFDHERCKSINAQVEVNGKVVAGGMKKIEEDHQLFEAEEKHGVLAFGRMNPPTSGHEKVIDKVHKVAKQHDAVHQVVLSHSQDAKKNPLDVANKVKYAKRAFPNTNIVGASKDAPTILHHAAAMHRAGVQHLHVVAGSDRTEEYEKLLHKYNGVKAGHGHYHFKSITVHSSGERDPDAEGAEGMSGTKMREHASNGDEKKFHSGLPSTMSHEHKHELYKDLRKAMGRS